MQDSANRLVIHGRIIELGTLRHTPAGLPVLNFRIAHASSQLEAGVARQVECELDAVALGDPALLLQGGKLEDEAELSGFLAARSVRSRQLVLHIEQIRFLEGTHHGI